MHWTNVEHAADVRRHVEAERERCAKIAIDQGTHYGEPAVGSAIANAIRATQKEPPKS